MGYRVYHEVPLNESLIINIGSNSIRKRLAEKFNSVNFATAIHPSSVISPKSSVGVLTTIVLLKILFTSPPMQLYAEMCLLVKEVRWAPVLW